MSVSIREAISAEDREQVFRLRYDVYVEEMGRRQVFSDATRRRIEEPWDETAHLFVAFSDEKPIGTIRYNRRAEGPLEHEELYEVEKFAPVYPDCASMTTKLVVNREYRKSGVGAHLMTHVYSFGRQQGVRLTFVDCRPHLLRLYQMLGCRLYRSNIFLPSSGIVIPLVMIADDVTYFEEIRSPILRYARRFPSGNETRTVFENSFPEYAKLRPQFLLPARELANRVAEELLGEPQAVIALLEGFAGPDASALLTQFDTVQFETGENIFSQGDHSAGMFVVLDGQVEIVRSGGHTDHVVAVMSRGDTFGEMGFLSDAPRSAGARASDRTRLLVLSTAEFERLSIVNPKLALHLLTNMFRLAALRFNEVVVTRSELWLRLERSTHKNI